MMRKRTVKLIVVNIVASVLGIFLVLFLTERHLRRTHDAYATFGGAFEAPWFRANTGDLTTCCTLDPDFGWRPILPSVLYDVHGIANNEYPLAKSPAKKRILFVGDSVTRIGFIIDSLKGKNGDEHYEYWNAGVDSFNTLQELKYYKRFNSAIDPDQVILTFSNNDFETTPIVFINDENRMILFSPYLPRDQVNGWLFQRSLLYRKYIAHRVARRKQQAREDLNDEIRAALQEFQRTLAENHIPFTVVVHPILKPHNEWAEDELRNHRDVLAMLEELGIRHFDLSETLWQVIAEGIDPALDWWPNDVWHPSRKTARRFARYLTDQNLLIESDG